MSQKINSLPNQLPGMLNAYAVWDEKSVRYNRPFFFQSHGEAIRAFHQTAQDETSMFNKYPDDFKLYFIGFYDEITARLETLITPPQLMATANEFKTQKNGVQKLK